MIPAAYRAGREELQKLAIKFQMPKLKLFKTKLKEHTVRGLGKIKPTTVKAQTTKSVVGRPEISVERMGTVGRMIPPPPVRT